MLWTGSSTFSHCEGNKVPQVAVQSRGPGSSHLRHIQRVGRGNAADRVFACYIYIIVGFRIINIIVISMDFGLLEQSGLSSGLPPGK